MVILSRDDIANVLGVSVKHFIESEYKFIDRLKKHRYEFERIEIYENILYIFKSKIELKDIQEITSILNIEYDIIDSSILEETINLIVGVAQEDILDVCKYRYIEHLKLKKIVKENFYTEDRHNIQLTDSILSKIAVLNI